MIIDSPSTETFLTVRFKSNRPRLLSIGEFEKTLRNFAECMVAYVELAHGKDAVSKYGGDLAYYELKLVCNGDEYDGIEFETFHPLGVESAEFKAQLLSVWDRTSLACK